MSIEYIHSIVYHIDHFETHWETIGTKKFDYRKRIFYGACRSNRDRMLNTELI